MRQTSQQSDPTQDLWELFHTRQLHCTYNLLNWFSVYFYGICGLVRYCRVIAAPYWDITSMIFFQMVWQEHVLRRRGKGRGFLPSLQVTGEGRTRRHEWRKRDEGWERSKAKTEGKRRQSKKGRGGNWSWVKENMGKKRAEMGDRKKQDRKNKATRPVGWECREGLHWALAAVLTLGSFLPTLSQMWAKEAQLCITHDTHRT